MHPLVRARLGLTGHRIALSTVETSLQQIRYMMAPGHHFVKAPSPLTEGNTSCIAKGHSNTPVQLSWRKVRMHSRRAPLLTPTNSAILSMSKLARSVFSQFILWDKSALKDVCLPKPLIVRPYRIATCIVGPGLLKDTGALPDVVSVHLRSSFGCAFRSSSIRVLYFSYRSHRGSHGRVHFSHFCCLSSIAPTPEEHMLFEHTPLTHS